MKNKNTLLYDFMEVYKSINCDTYTVIAMIVQIKSYVIL